MEQWERIVKEDVDKYMVMPIESMPLFINSDDIAARLVAKHRLRMGV